VLITTSLNEIKNESKVNFACSFNFGTLIIKHKMTSDNKIVNIYRWLYHIYLAKYLLCSLAMFLNTNFFMYVKDHCIPHMRDHIDGFILYILLRLEVQKANK
jgi:hypothetical protein